MFLFLLVSSSIWCAIVHRRTHYGGKTCLLLTLMKGICVLSGFFLFYVEVDSLVLSLRTACFMGKLPGRLLLDDFSDHLMTKVTKQFHTSSEL